MSIRSILCYGDSNTYGTVPASDPFSQERLAREVRWPGVLQAGLGSAWIVIEEGLPGRTTVHDDPVEGAHKNGLSHLKTCLETHRPIDVVILMLGTNDLKTRFSVPPGDVARGVGVLCETALACAAGPGAGVPRLVVVAPTPIIETGYLGEMFGGGAAKSERLAPLYRELAARLGAAFLDAGAVARVSPVDGVHLDASDHRRLGEAVAQIVAKL